MAKLPFDKKLAKALRAIKKRRRELVNTGKLKVKIAGSVEGLQK